MYSRGTSSNGFLRLAAGALIVCVAVIAFSLFQGYLSRPKNEPIPTNTPTSAPHVTTAASTPTPQPVQLRIVSSKAGLSAVIIEVYLAKNEDNWDLTQLTTYAGHLQGTAGLKQGGNFVLAGHVEMHDGSAGPFAKVGALAPGDPIDIVSSKPGNPVVIQYIVTKVERVNPDDFAVVRNHGYEELTLITCADWDPNDHSYHTRVVVHARPVAAKGSA
jgi:LPXTG-site transpeptidase (sortase) family protein